MVTQKKVRKYGPISVMAKAFNRSRAVTNGIYVLRKDVCLSRMHATNFTYCVSNK